MASYSRQLNLNEAYDTGNEVDDDVNLNIDQFRQEFPRSFDLNLSTLRTNLREVNNFSHTYCNKIDVMKNNIEGDRVIDLNIDQFRQEFPRSSNSRQLNLNEEYDTRNEVDGDVMINNIKGARVIDLNINQLRQEFPRSSDLNRPALNTNLREVNNISHTYCDKIDVIKSNIEGARVIDLNIDQIRQEFPKSSDSQQLNLNEEYDTRNEVDGDVMINNIEGARVFRQDIPKSFDLNQPTLGTNLREVNNTSYTYCDKIDVMKNNIEGARVIDLNINQLRQEFPKSLDLNQPALGTNLREVNHISHTYCDKIDVIKNNIEGPRVIYLNIDQLRQEFPRSFNSRQLNLNEEYDTRNEDDSYVMINNIEVFGVIDLNNDQLRQELPRSSDLNRPALSTNLREVNDISHSYCEKIHVMKNNIEGARVIDLNIDQLRQGFSRSLNLNRPALGSNLQEVNNISHTYCNKVGNAKKKWPMEMKTSQDEDDHEKKISANLEITSSSSSPPPSTDHHDHQRPCMYNLDLNSEYTPDDDDDDDDDEENHPKKKKKDGGIPSDLIVMGCFRCLMYVMVSGAEPQCPKCKSTVLIDQFRVKPPSKK